MKRLVALILLIAACASAPAGSYAIVLDPSLKTYAPAVRSALQQRVSKADFIDTVLPADKHEAVVLVRYADGEFVYDVYRGETIVRKGRARDPKTLSRRIGRDLGRL